MFRVKAVYKQKETDTIQHRLTRVIHIDDTSQLYG